MTPPPPLADIRRDNRPELKKAGNLRHAFAQTVGEITAVFDADFCPRPDFLRETLPYFLDRSIGIVQTPQFFRRTEEQTWVEQGAGASQEAFYRMIQVRSSAGQGWVRSKDGGGVRSKDGGGRDGAGGGGVGG